MNYIRKISFYLFFISLFAFAEQFYAETYLLGGKKGWSYVTELQPEQDDTETTVLYLIRIPERKIPTPTFCSILKTAAFPTRQEIIQ